MNATRRINSYGNVKKVKIAIIWTYDSKIQDTMLPKYRYLNVTNFNKTGNKCNLPYSYNNSDWHN